MIKFISAIALCFLSFTATVQADQKIVSGDYAIKYGVPQLDESGKPKKDAQGFVLWMGTPGEFTFNIMVDGNPENRETHLHEKAKIYFQQFKTMINFRPPSPGFPVLPITPFAIHATLDLKGFYIVDDSCQSCTPGSADCGTTTGSSLPSGTCNTDIQFIPSHIPIA